MKKVYLADMRKRLQAIMNYDQADKAFEALLFGWNKHRGASGACLDSLKRRGCMSTRLAKEFADYVGYPIDEEPQNA